MYLQVKFRCYGCQAFNKHRNFSDEKREEVYESVTEIYQHLIECPDHHIEGYVEVTSADMEEIKQSGE